MKEEINDAGERTFFIRSKISIDGKHWEDAVVMWSDTQMIPKDKGWLEDNIEIVNIKGKVAEVIVPNIKKYKIYEDSKGRYVIIKGMKIYSRYL